MQAVVNKSDLIANLAAVCDDLEEHVVDEAVRLMMAMMVEELIHDGRIIVLHASRAIRAQARAYL